MKTSKKLHLYQLKFTISILATITLINKQQFLNNNPPTHRFLLKISNNNKKLKATLQQIQKPQHCFKLIQLVQVNLAALLSSNKHKAVPLQTVAKHNSKTIHSIKTNSNFNKLKETNA